MKYFPGCYTPENYADGPAGKYLTFKDAQDLLNSKNNEDEDTNFGLPVLGVFDNTTDPYKPINHYRRNYMAGILRLHQAGHLRHQYHQPGMYYWSNLRRNNSIQNILQAISDALGYESDVKHEFTINNPLNEPRQVKFNLSVQAFCSAMLDMIPFSRDILSASLVDLQLN
uniref:Uncharacterized protein n=1 Tax=Romanomermis culicivorax TaxID=13658 RepID=A0A915JRL8_ROMCU